MHLLINETVLNKLTDEQVLLFADEDNGPDECDFYTHFGNCDFKDWCDVSREGDRLLRLVLPSYLIGTYLQWVIEAIISAAACSGSEHPDSWAFKKIDWTDKAKYGNPDESGMYFAAFSDGTLETMHYTGVDDEAWKDGFTFAGATITHWAEILPECHPGYKA